MEYRRYNHRLFLHFAAAMFVLAGCAPQKREPIRVYPGKESALDSLSLLRSRSQNIGPMKANGQCFWRYYSKGKPRRENFAVKVWMNPPVEIYLQGDVAFNPRGIVLGSNASEFWLLMKPKVSSYSWGKWSEQGSSVTLTNISKTLVEALGIVEVVDEKNWSLSNEGAFDVLVKRNDEGGIIKKIYINCYDYLVRKIVYFDAGGKAVAVAELDKYKEVSKEFFVPTAIRVIMRGEGGVHDSASITLSLKSVKSTVFTEKQRNLFFNRPKTKGYKHIYRIIGGRMIELQE